MKYRKVNKQENNVLGMLHIVEVRLTKKKSGEKIKQKLLMVGFEAADIERKLRWIFDSTIYDTISISEVEKVREKIHTLSTIITQEKPEPSTIIRRNENSAVVGGATLESEQYHPNLYAIGVVTTMMASDESHALRKVGRALMNSTLDVGSSGGPRLSDDAVVNIEQIAKSSGYALPRDTSAEVNRAHFVRG